MPHTEEQEHVLLTLIAEMERQEGSGVFLKAVAPNENIQLGLIERFRDERAQEGLPTPTPEESLQISSGQEE